MAVIAVVIIIMAMTGGGGDCLGVPVLLGFDFGPQVGIMVSQKFPLYSYPIQVEAS